MNTYLLEIGFFDIVWFMVIIFVWSMVFWLFVITVGDVFRRDDLSGMSKALWLVALLFLPLLGILIYMITRPAVTPSDVRLAEQARQMMGSSGADEITKAQELLKSGAITQEEFDKLKSRVLA